MRAVDVVRHARGQGRPMLFLLHRQPDNQMVQRQWQDYMKRTSSSKVPMRLLADCYCVIGLPLRELPALSPELGVPPFSAPRQGGPMLWLRTAVVSRWVQQLAGSHRTQVDL